ncbi:sulfite exporter TauE/SafE family protein [Rathayibacter sp. YIM 133350]|uniref:sulfite exporter TauE/SafE family protein n=1 Tax=Rathayibacter sp. YIM 133350 TaxID=3131992 RepID=UPI00307EB803
MSAQPVAPEATPARRGHWALLLLVGVVGGVFSGLFGVGGGTIIVPLLIIVAGMGQRQASATSLAAIVPTAIAGCASYLAGGRVDLAAGLFLAIGGIVGSYLGALLLRRIRLDWLRWLFILLLVIAAVDIIVDTPTDAAVGVALTLWTALALIGVGLIMGIASGLFGIGGGIVAVPSLIALFGVGVLAAKGTSLLAMVPTALSGTVANWRGGLVDLRAALIVGLAATASSFAGVALAFWLPTLVATWLFVALMAYVIVELVLRALRDGRADRARRVEDARRSG